jgi:predicted enzyme related to lactoylglutathione lyase
LNAVKLVIFPAADVPKATKFFSTLLGVEPYADSAYYVGFRTGDMEVGLVPRAAHRAEGALTFVDVTDINAALAALLASGAEKVQDPTDVAQGLLVAIVKDPDGNPIGLRQFPT